MARRTPPWLLATAVLAVLGAIWLMIPVARRDHERREGADPFRAEQPADAPVPGDPPSSDPRAAERARAYEQALASRAGRADARARLVDGVVHDIEGRAIAGAEVGLCERRRTARWRRRGRPLGEARLLTTTDDDGRFTLSPLPAGEAFTLRVRAAGHATALADVPAAGAWMPITLAPASVLRIRVSDLEDSPVVGAIAVFTLPEGSHDARTDGDGVATFDALASGAGQVRVTHPAHRVHVVDVVPVVAGEAHDVSVVLEPAGRLSGRVVDAASGRPLTDATVVASIPSAPTLPPADPVTTSADGAFAVPDCAGPNDRLHLVARRAGYVDAEVLRAARDEGDLVIAMRRGRPRRVEGRVLDANGTAAAGAGVELGAAAGVLDVDPTSTRANARGEYAIDLPTAAAPGGLWIARATTANGEIGLATFVVPRDEDSMIPRVDIVTAPVGALAGTIVDADGSGALGAEVRLEPITEHATPSTRLLLREMARDGSALTAVTDADGRFEAFGLPVASYAVTARRAGMVARSTEPVAVRAHEVASIELRLAEGGRIAGRVVDEAGAPIPGVSLRALPDGGATAPGHGATTVRSDGLGRFEFAGLVWGRFRIAATRTGWSSIGGETRASAGDANVVVAMRARGAIRLDVRDGDVGHRGLVALDVRRADPPALDGSGVVGAGTRLLRIENGVVDVEDLDAGTWLIEVSARDGRLARGAPIVVRGGERVGPVAMELRPTATIEGRVSTPDGDPAALAEGLVQATPWRDDDAASATTSPRRVSARLAPDGRYRLEGVAAGRHLVTVWLADGATWTTETRVAEGESLRLDLVREAPARVEAFVVDPSGRPVSGARITLRRLGGASFVPSYRAMHAAGLANDPEEWVRIVTTDGHGHAEVPLVPPGTYDVVPVRPGWRVVGAPARVTVDAGGRAEARVSLEFDASALDPPADGGR